MMSTNADFILELDIETSSFLALRNSFLGGLNHNGVVVCACKPDFDLRLLSPLLRGVHPNMAKVPTIPYFCCSLQVNNLMVRCRCTPHRFLLVKPLELLQSIIWGPLCNLRLCKRANFI